MGAIIIFHGTASQALMLHTFLMKTLLTYLYYALLDVNITIVM